MKFTYSDTQNQVTTCDSRWLHGHYVSPAQCDRNVVHTFKLNKMANNCLYDLVAREILILVHVLLFAVILHRHR